MPDQQGSEEGPATTSAELSPWAVAGLGMQFFAALILFVYAGNWMDTRFGSSPICLLIGVLIGGGGTFYLSYRRLTRALDAADAARAKAKRSAPRS